MSITFLTFTLWHKLFGNLYNNSKQKPYSLEEDAKNQIIKWTVFVVMIVITLLVMFSRILLGVHSIDQVIYGCSISIGMMISFYGIVDIFEEFSAALEFFYNNTKGILILVGYFVLEILIIICLVTSIPDPKEQDQWNTMLVKKCPNIDPFKKFKGESIIGSSLIAITLGAWLGSLAFIRVSKITNVKVIFNWQPSDLCKRFECYGILVGLLVVPFCMHFIPVGSNFWAILIVNYISPFLLSFFVCFFPGFMLLRYLKLTKEFESNDLPILESEVSKLGV